MSANAIRQTNQEDVCHVAKGVGVGDIEEEAGDIGGEGLAGGHLFAVTGAHLVQEEGARLTADGQPRGRCPRRCASAYTAHRGAPAAPKPSA